MENLPNPTLDRINDFKKQPWKFTSLKEKPDFHTMALLAAQTLPNQSINELLANAEKIEWWLRKEERESYEFSIKMQESFKSL